MTGAMAADARAAPRSHDLTAVAALVVAYAAVAALGWVGTLPGIVLGVAYVLVAPGYALVAALFPEADEAGGLGKLRLPSAGLPLRAVLGVGASMVVVPLLGVALNLSPVGMGPLPLVGAVGAFALGFAAVAAVRRRRLPADRRYGVGSLSVAGAWPFAVESRTDDLLRLALVTCIGVGLAAGAYAVAVPAPNESFTEFGLLAQNESGELRAADYPRQFETGQARDVFVLVGNREGHRQSYGLVVRLQRVGDDRIRTVERLSTRRFAVAAGQSTVERVSVQPTTAGENLRVQFLLYRGDPPEDPGARSAYREAHIDVTVSG